MKRRAKEIYDRDMILKRNCKSLRRKLHDENWFPFKILQFCMKIKYWKLYVFTENLLIVSTNTDHIILYS